jgi:hypothetical protein
MRHRGLLVGLRQGLDEHSRGPVTRASNAVALQTRLPAERKAVDSSLCWSVQHRLHVKMTRVRV